MLERLYCYGINSLCCWLYKKEYKRQMGLGSVQEIQKKVLMGIIQRNQNTEYGKKYHFNEIHDPADFQQKLPLTDYEDYTKAITRLQEKGVNELFSEPILLLEITSGSTAASKYIPYNQSLKSEFQKGIKPWVYNLYTSYKGVKWGKSYWSITPATTQRQYTKSGIPIGFEEDSAYFGRLERRLINSVFAVPAHVAKLADMDEFYFETTFHLLSCKHLTLISVWNPTYLLLLLEFMTQHREELTQRIAEKDRKRAAYVDQVLLKHDYTKLWKHLKVISCWCDGNAEVYAKKLERLFPDAMIQPKGLLATEGFVSFPLAHETGARLSVYSHFFEFQSSGDRQVALAHELEINQEYQVILTTSGGLYRYQLKDLVRVVDIKNGLPLIKFIGKSDKVSDLFGEKLSEGFVQETLVKLKIQADFWMVAPEIDHYVLYIQADSMPVGVDEALRENFHYDYCRKLGQLKPLKIFKLTGNPEEEYLKGCVTKGQRLGDIKPTRLYLLSGFDQLFKGEYL